MSTVKTNNVQVGQSGTATQNFTLYQPSTPDGTVRLAVGNAGATSLDVLTANSSGNVGIGTSSPTTKVHALTPSATAVAFRAGNSVSFAEFQVDASGNSQLIAPGGTQIFNTNGFERMRIDSSGNVGIGTSSPSTKLDVNGNIAGGSLNVFGTGVPANGINNVTTNTLGFFTNSTERARITSGGRFVIGSTSSSGTLTVDGIDVISLGSVDTYAITCGNDDRSALAFGSDSTYAYIQSFGGRPLIINQQGNEVRIAGVTDNGAYNLQCLGTGVWGAGAYVNGSDERIKEDIAPITSGLDVVTKLNPVTYRYKEDWSKDQSTQTGFIAQELLVAMEGKNYVDGVVQQGGSEGYYSVAYQNIIPLLTKAIQEQQQMIEELKAKVAALENK